MIHFRPHISYVWLLGSMIKVAMDFSLGRGECGYKMHKGDNKLAIYPLIVLMGADLFNHMEHRLNKVVFVS